ncbi:hypothetical protein GGI1_24211 [Acidithiobacillus sp. GGI-221]|nr:hypothetical protein GGI1_24211 [Acidithiobacillus sp. GGI-221]
MVQAVEATDMAWIPAIGVGVERRLAFRRTRDSVDRGDPQDG